jgi:hypothetical protein
MQRPHQQTLEIQPVQCTQSVSEYVSHYLNEKMLPFDSYEANKIALSLAHIDVSSANPTEETQFIHIKKTCFVRQ